MGWQSTIPDAISYLVQMWTDANPGVWVTDGPALGNDNASLLVTVGYDGNDGSVVSETSAEGFDGSPNREAYTIYCCAVAAQGDDQAAVRQSAFDLFTACTAALEADRTLGGIALRAMPGEVTVKQSAGTSGRSCWLTFGVSVLAFTKDAS